ncbi:MAG: UvrB/UvrC motif-containing protein [Treponema sp.]|nr:UvrB/UvrC motif-containing protein [Treponema sp.]
MICDFCHEREAVFFIEQSGPSARRALNICMECALERGVTADPRSLEKNIGGLFAELARISQKASEQDKRVCPVCGTSLLSIKRTNQLGCPECYAVFKTEVQELLKQKGVQGTYTGSMPRRLSKFKSVLTDRIMIQAKLEDSLRKEDYEKAAVYRDYLKALEKQPVSGGDATDGTGDGDA